MISIIVPVYNVGPYLRKCIDSILRQTYSDFELILVDDGSTDESAQICDQYKEIDERVVVIHKQNSGPNRARKTGLQRARGEYVCYVDGDDWIEDDMIEHQLTEIQSSGADLAVSNLYFESEGWMQKVCGTLDAGLYNTEDIVGTMLYTGEFYKFGISQYACTKLFRKDMLWDVQMPVDNRIGCGEDVAVLYPYILKAQTVYISDYAGYHYIQRTNSIQGRYDSDEFARNKVLIAYLRNIFEQSAYAECLNRQLNQYAKNLFLTRNIACFDASRKEEILIPYGGIPANARIILYGAGRMGQSLYRYLKDQLSIEVLDWLDKNFMTYQRSGMGVHSPECLKDLQDTAYDFIVIAVNDQKAVKGICRYIEEMGINREKMKWLSENFIGEDYYILDEFV